jgi:hypothetical protein
VEGRKEGREGDRKKGKREGKEGRKEFRVLEFPLFKFQGKFTNIRN